MGIQLQQTDTVADHGSIAACSSQSAGTTVDSKTVTSGGTPGVTTPQIGQTATSPRRDIHWETAAAELDSYSILSGNWVVRLNVTTADAVLLWDSCFICRVNSFGVSQGTIGSLQNQALSLSTTGVKTMTVSGGASSASPGDRIYIVLGFTSNNSAHNINYRPDQLIDTPMTSAPPPATKQQPQWDSTWDFGGIAGY